MDKVPPKKTVAEKSSTITMRYRAEIDGLRAVAVIPVILYHAGFSLFSGGFVGVDVFFVISGYLITTIILSELEEGEFSIVNFYERRARRILPALFVVLLTCLPFAWFWLLPQDMKSFSQSLMAVSVFASNFLFWRTSGYFDIAANLKPLIHTWSLAVEEQYYIVFPLLLMLAWRLGKRWIVAIIAVLAVLSLTVAEWTSPVKPAAAFYLLPTRAWELLIGAFIAFYFSRRKTANLSQRVSEIGGWIGLALLIYSIFAFDKETPFPSVYSLAPTIGAALIILCATQQTVVGKFLSKKLFVGVGLISYSAYLWHQPLFAFARYRAIDEPSKLVFGGLAISALFLAYFSWKYIEVPFRNRSRVGRKSIFCISIAGSLFFASFGLIGHFNKGYQGRITGEQAVFLRHFYNDTPEWKYFVTVGIPDEFRFQCDFYDIPKYRSGIPTYVPLDSIAGECHVKRSGSEKVLFVWGDSHAQQLYAGLRREMPSGWQILQVASSGCKAALNASPSKTDYCEYSNWFAYKTISEVVPDVVVVGQKWKHDVSDMLSISGQLRSIGVKKVIFTGPSPHWYIDLPHLVAQKFLDSVPRKTFSGVDKEIMLFDRSLRRDFPQSDSVRFVSLIDYFCDETGCDVYYGDSVKDGITTYDSGHLTPVASHRFARDILVREVLSKPDGNMIGKRS